MIGRFVIVRSRDQGVVCGVLRAISGRAVELDGARQIHGWSDGANTLFEMALRGCGTARISEPVAEILILDVCGVIPCTPVAERNLKQSRWNRSFDASASPRPRPKSRD
jgi:hypothetical protein